MTKQLQVLANCLRSLWLAATLLTAPTLHAITAAELIAQAPVLVIGLDNSGSSPATSDQVVGAAWPEVEATIRRLPMAATVKVFTIGDSRALFVSPPPLRIQKKVTENGGPSQYVIEEVRKIVLGFPDQVRKGLIQEHGQSELVGGFNDASKLLNRNSKENAIILISDLIENSRHANCYKDLQCKLPAPTFSLAGAEVTVIGVGSGLPAKHGMSVAASWLDFLGKAGATTGIDKLRRVN